LVASLMLRAASSIWRPFRFADIAASMTRCDRSARLFAECAGQAEFVPDAIELDHVSEPQISPKRASRPARAPQRQCPCKQDWLILAQWNYRVARPDFAVELQKAKARAALGRARLIAASPVSPRANPPFRKNTGRDRSLWEMNGVERFSASA
jgi:hypothetical protein